MAEVDTEQQEVLHKNTGSKYIFAGAQKPNVVRADARHVRMRCQDLEKMMLDGKGWVTRDIPIYNDDGSMRSHEDIDADKNKFKTEMFHKNQDYKSKATGRPLQFAKADNGQRKIVETGIEDGKVTTKETVTKTDMPTDDKPRDVKGRRIVPNIKYEPFDLRLDPNTGNTTVVFGSSKRGKTEIMLHIYKEYYDKDSVVAVGMFKNMQDPRYDVNNLVVMGAYSPKTIDLMYDINKKSRNKFEFLVMLDDFIQIKDSTVDNLVLTLRNADISTVCSLQYVRLLSKASRGSVNNVLIFGMNSEEARRDAIAIYLKSWMDKKLKETGIRYPSDSDRDELFVAVTDNHGFFYIRPEDDVVRTCRLDKE